MKKLLLIFLIVLTASLWNANAQFRPDKLLGTQLNNTVGPPGSEVQTDKRDTTSVPVDTTQGFSIKRAVRGYFHKDTLTPGYLLLGSVVVPGASQLYNKQYWKVPLTYAGIGSGLFCGIWGGNQYKKTGQQKYKTLSTIGYVGAGLVYWGQMLDGVVNFSTSVKAPVPAKATIYSLLLPGLGQAYVGDYWKIPIWYGGFAACGYFFHINNMQYKRFKYIYDISLNPAESGYTGAITNSQAKWYKDTYRRYRDYSVLAAIIVYALQAIDANVFAYMSDFNVDNNIASIEVRPTVINPIMPELQRANPNQMAQGIGASIQLNF